jgi:hypothetical protein
MAKTKKLSHKELEKNAQDETIKIDSMLQKVELSQI